jgi:hypothetical protein
MPALKQLMDAARRREIDVICVWKFDRMSISIKTLGNTRIEGNASSSILDDEKKIRT